MSMRDKLIQKAKDLGLPAKTEDVIRGADKAVHEAKAKAATYADENRDKLGGYVDKAGQAVDERTQGKYSDKVAKAKEAATRGVDKVVEQRPPAPVEPQVDPGQPPTSATPTDRPVPGTPPVDPDQPPTNQPPSA
ncbi:MULTISPECIES: antitoxin [unclassified Knoellia]|uniref:antitoxin n=1 Tax=Knoellia altitudinis TaxID=3404795 RepID=UPI00361EA340